MSGQYSSQHPAVPVEEEDGERGSDANEDAARLYVDSYGGDPAIRRVLARYLGALSGG